jgi:type I restriction enzyme S subunit
VNTRNGWQRVKFGDVVRNVGESVADPVSAGLERAVGLEHLEAGELEVTGWVATGDGLTFTRRFRAGQVLFGRRRAYQRKVAIADFDGVCSGDIYVLEPTNDRLVAALLPFIVQSEQFFQYALRTSAGSLSPRTKWTALKNYEFELPPIDEQRQIADLLWSAERMCRCARALSRAAREAEGCAVEDAVRDGWREVALGEVLDLCQYGLSLAASESGSVPIIGMNEVSEGGVQLATSSTLSSRQRNLTSFGCMTRMCSLIEPIASITSAGLASTAARGKSCSLRTSFDFGRVRNCSPSTSTYS